MAFATSYRGHLPCRDTSQMRRQKGAKCSSPTHSTAVDSAWAKTWAFRAAPARQYDGEPAEVHGFHRYICYVGRGRLLLADIAPAD